MSVILYQQYSKDYLLEVFYVVTTEYEAEVRKKDDDYFKKSGFHCTGRISSLE